MKFLLVHNYYQQAGGEDEVFADEVELLRNHGHEVVTYTVHNDAVKGVNKLQLAAKTIWNRQARAELKALIRREKPVLMHCANTLPLVSPGAYYTAHAEGLAVVQTLHNYRLLCPNALFFREGKVCEDCLGKLFAWPAVKHGCYRQSRATSAAVAGMLTTHRMLGTWKHKVDRYIALTQFAADKFISGGLPADKIVVKSNFITPDPGPGKGQGGYALFIGRLVPEKGVPTLLEAWRKMPAGLPLKIVGDGPLADSVREAAAQLPNVEWLGRRTRAEVHALLQDASILAAPSEWYEGAVPRTILEAHAAGTPVVAARLGCMAGGVAHGQTGRLFEPGNAQDLIAQVEALTADPRTLLAYRRAARQEYEDKYTAANNYRQLMAVYAGALQTRGNRAAAAECLQFEHLELPATDMRASESRVPVPAVTTS
jgi:glycosyltransferase involved in cell wall biosynthesis